MNAHVAILPAKAAPRHWHLDSGIIPCSTCEGEGGRWRDPYGSGNDPDNWLIECPDCEGVGHHACEVCGFDIEIPGYDCLACDMAQDVPAKLMEADTADALAKAVSKVFAVAKAQGGAK